MDLQRILFISGGAVAMFIVSFLLRKNYNLTVLKCLLLTAIVTVLGVASVMLMFFFENGVWGGTSFFGAVLFEPILIIPVALLLKWKVSNVLDLLAPMISVMCAIMKIDCLINGCCAGMAIYYDEQGFPIYFPSQLVEMITGFVVCAALVTMIKFNKNIGRVYPVYLVGYGIIRFILNSYRRELDIIFGLRIGNIWSIVAVVIGVIWLIVLFVIKRNNKAKQP